MKSLTHKRDRSRRSFSPRCRQKARFRPVKAPAFVSLARILLAGHAFPLRSKTPLFVWLPMRSLTGRSLTGNSFDGACFVVVARPVRALFFFGFFGTRPWSGFAGASRPVRYYSVRLTGVAMSVCPTVLHRSRASVIARKSCVLRARSTGSIYHMARPWLLPPSLHLAISCGGWALYFFIFFGADDASPPPPPQPIVA